MTTREITACACQCAQAAKVMGSEGVPVQDVLDAFLGEPTKLLLKMVEWIQEKDRDTGSNHEEFDAQKTLDNWAKKNARGKYREWGVDEVSIDLAPLPSQTMRDDVKRLVAARPRKVAEYLRIAADREQRRVS